ncbi:MAG: Fe-Mn family superoxide dismutase [Enterobacterales bacterium]
MNLILPSLPYKYDDMEPYIDEKTMKIHHDKHHRTYTNNVNNILSKFPEFDNITADKLITQIENLPDNIKTLIRNNIGGYINHNIFWKGLKIGTSLHGLLKKSIIKNFGSVELFKEIFENVSMSCFGSGWTWLVNQNNKLLVVKTSNQDNPMMGEFISGTFGYPIIGLDLWEHAYYLKYQNRRQDYIVSFWNIVNWDEASIRFGQSKNI